MRKETGDDRWWCRYDNHMTCKFCDTLAYLMLIIFIVKEILKVNLSRPFILSFTEPILWFWNAYIAVCAFFERPLQYLELLRKEED